jgi:predicted MFS family arabinose efflux permease
MNENVSRSSASPLSTFPRFLVVVLLWSLAFGGIEYLLKNFSLEPLQEDSTKLLEDVVGFMSVGSMLAYALGGAISYMGQKRTMIVVAGVLSIVVLLLEQAVSWSFLSLLVASSVLLGFFYGMFAVVRSIMVSIEILKTGLRETVVNGVTNIAFTVGIIASIYAITRTYELSSMFCLWFVIGLIALTCVLALSLKYTEYEVHHPPLTSLYKSWKEMLWIVKRMYVALIPSGMLWGITTVVGVWALPYAQKVHGIPESKGSFILLFTAVGVILGNIAVMRIKNRWLWVRLITYAFAAIVAGFTVLTSTFVNMIVYAIVLGITMGAATNLVDSYYLRFVGEQKVKENGAALLGLVTNGTVAFLLLLLRAIPESAQAFALGGIAVATGLFVRIKLRTIRGYE